MDGSVIAERGSVRHFVILYRGREGSSPLISTLGKHPAIHVPLFETLDFYAARQFARPDNIARYVERALDGEAIEENGTKVAQPMPNGGRVQTIGFKWRMWGDAPAVTSTLARRQAAMFHLFRRDLLDLAASLYFSNTVIPSLEERDGVDLSGGGHLQFKIARMAPAARQEMLGRLRSVSFRFPPEEFEVLARRIIKDKRGKLEMYLDPLREAGCPVYSILYEDFCNAREGLVAAIDGVLGVNPAEQQSLDTNYVKVTGSDFLEQVENLDELRADPRLPQLVRAYERLIFERHTYLGPI